MKGPDCPDCGTNERDLDRRAFLKATGVAGAAVTAAPLLATAAGPRVLRAPQSAGESPASETLVTQLYGSLTEEQKQLCAFPFDHPLRERVDNNWRITRAQIGRAFEADQQDLIRQIFNGLHSPEYAESVMQQVEHDNGRGGFNGCAVALFGEPGDGPFEFVLSGRHVTRRCDGNSVEGAAFGGPIFYGHAATSFNEPADHPGNAYWYQAVRANELFQALDGRQQSMALRDDPREERGTETVRLSGESDNLPGLAHADLTPDQRELAEKVMEDVLAPFREEDRRESMELIRSTGMEHLHYSFFKNLDIGDDQVWDVWQIEGPNMLWYFRGHPHVHTWVNIRQA